MDYALLIGVIIMNASQYLVSSLYNKRQKNADAYLCTLIIGIVVVAFYSIYGAINGGFSFGDGTTVLYGLLFGLGYCMGYIFQILALRYGEVSLTSLIMSYSLLIPTFFGIIYYRDPISVLFWIALALLAIAMFLVNYKKTDKNAPKTVGKNRVLWITFTMLAFVGNGMCTIFSTLQQRITGGQYRSEFMIYAMAIVLAVNFTLMMVNNSKTHNTLPSLKNGWWCAAILGVLNAATNLFVMMLVSSNNLSMSLIYSMVSAGGLLITFICAMIFFKEKLRPMQIAGFFIGLASVVLFNIKL